MKSIFLYQDYRRFLSDFYDEKKRSCDYSYRRFSQKAGLRSPNYLALIMDHKRDLTIANIHQFAEALELRSDEVEYFETLVLLNQSSTEVEKRYYEDRRKRLVRGRSKEISRKAPVDILREWSSMAIMVLSHGRSVEEACEKSRTELGMKISEIQKTIEELISLGLLIQLENGTIQISTNQITMTDPKGLSLAQEKFLLSQLQQSCKAFQHTYKKKTGKFISHSMTIPPGALEKLHHRLISFVEELTNEMDAEVEGTEAQVAQINIQLFRPRAWE